MKPDYIIFCDSLSNYGFVLEKGCGTRLKNPTVLKTVFGYGYVLVDSKKESKAEQTVYQLDSKPERVYVHPGFEYWSERGFVRVGGEEVRLSPTERRLLDLLTRFTNRIVSNSAILHNVWATSENPAPENVKNLVLSLRKKIEPAAHHGQYKYLLTERGVGYRLVDPGKE